MKKQLGIVLVCMLMLSGMTLAFELSNAKAYKLGSSSKIQTSGIIQYADKGSLIIEQYCTHEGKVIPLETLKIAITQSKETFSITTNTKECTTKDIVTIKIGEYSSEDIVVKYKGSSRRKVIEPVVIIEPTKEELIEQEYTSCKQSALEWFNTNKEQRYAGFFYDLKIDKCEYNKEKALCELKEGYDWKFNKCVKEHKHDRD